LKDQLISIEDIKKVHPVFQKSYGDFLARCVMKISGLYKANRVYDSAKYKTGTDIEDAMIDGLGIHRKVRNIDVLRQFDGQPFITVSNHPYGHIDGIMLIGEVAKVRPDFKVMVNWVLGMVDIMGDHFVSVNPYTSGPMVDRSSLAGIKESIGHLKANHPLGFFPAGAISKNRLVRIEDRAWQPNVLRLIQKAKVPVVPVFVTGNNSWFFNLLDLIDWRLRTVRLCHELTNKQNRVLELIFGQPISVEEQSQYHDVVTFGKFLKAKTYELKVSG